MKWLLVEYSTLNNRAKENYDFAKLAARLADWGWHCLRITDDWGGADMIAVHIDKGRPALKIQLKGRLSFFKRYIGAELHIAFPHQGQWYLYDYDKLLTKFPAIRRTESWKKPDGGYSAPGLSVENMTKLRPYLIPRPKTRDEQS